MGTPSAMLDAYAEIATRPAIMAVEAVGLVLLGWLARRYRLYRKSSLKRFLMTGRPEVYSDPGTPREHTSQEGEG
jgi:hypothetical protein